MGPASTSAIRTKESDLCALAGEVDVDKGSKNIATKEGFSPYLAFHASKNVYMNRSY